MTDVVAAFDDSGAPILLVAGASVVVPTRSGNPAHEVGSGRFGRFGSKDEKEEQAPSKPQPDPAEGSQERRRDAVVDAARSLASLEPSEIEKFMRSRWRGDRAITAADIASFAADVRTQRIHDVVDALDFRIRRAVNGRAGSKQTHVSIPRGLATKSLAGLEREDLLRVFQRLRDRGWNDRQIKRFGVRRIDSSDKRLQSLLSGSS